jgi:hypothetical protein
MVHFTIELDCRLKPLIRIHDRCNPLLLIITPSCCLLSANYLICQMPSTFSSSSDAKKTTNGASPSSMKELTRLLSQLQCLEAIPKVILEMISEYAGPRHYLIMIVKGSGRLSHSAYLLDTNNMMIKGWQPLLPHDDYEELWTDTITNSSLVSLSTTSLLGSSRYGYGEQLYRMSRAAGSGEREVILMSLNVPTLLSHHYHYHQAAVAPSSISPSSSASLTPSRLEWSVINTDQKTLAYRHRMIAIDDRYLMKLPHITHAPFGYSYSDTAKFDTDPALFDGRAAAAVAAAASSSASPSKPGKWIPVKKYERIWPDLVTTYNGSVYCWSTPSSGRDHCFTPPSLPVASLVHGPSDSIGWRTIPSPPPTQPTNPPFVYAISIPNVGILLIRASTSINRRMVIAAYDPLTNLYRSLEWLCPLFDFVSCSFGTTQLLSFNGDIIMVTGSLNSYSKLSYRLPLQLLMDTSKVGIQQLPETIDTSHWLAISCDIPFTVSSSVTCAVMV